LKDTLLQSKVALIGYFDMLQYIFYMTDFTGNFGMAYFSEIIKYFRDQYNDKAVSEFDEFSFINCSNLYFCLPKILDNNDGKEKTEYVTSMAQLKIVNLKLFKKI
ncbi:MAG: hypothetical protein KAR07_11440, partial [Spirochaetes bacterium]|nr:hypothetical protein [Spirochaetota bacterium]